MFDLAKLNRRSSSRGQIAIEGTNGSVLILPGGHYRVALKLSSINFELKSQAEQDIVIDSYESFLNSLGFSFQILIRTRQLDISSYLEGIEQMKENEEVEVFKDQLKSYRKFISSLVRSNKILSRQFFVIIPFDAKSKTDFEVIEKQLNLKLGILTKGLHALGIKAKQLSALDILDLFYSYYSPSAFKLQPLSKRALSLIHNAYVRRDNEVVN